MLEKLYQNIAISTWDRFEFSNMFGFKYGETTITENLLFEIYKYKVATLNSSIQIFEALDEKTNGNDIELYIEVAKNKYLFLVLQAKKVYMKNKFKYTQISHKVNRIYQIDLLENYARRERGIPLYLLYNYYDGFFKSKKVSNHKYFGCSLIDTRYIQKTFRKTAPPWDIPTFLDLNNIESEPLCVLAQKLLYHRHIFKRMGINKISDYIHSKSDLILSKKWIEVKESKLIKSPKGIKAKALKNDIDYSSKYRIIINMKEE